MNEQARKSIQAPDTQDKMNSYFRKQSSSQSLLKEKKLETDSNIYNFSEVTEQNKEENEEDLAIMSVFGGAKAKDPSPEVKRKSKAASQKLPTSKRPVSQRKPRQFNKLDDSEKEKEFLSVYDENLKIKENQRQQEKYYAQLEVKFTTLDKQMKSFKSSIGGATTGKSDAHRVAGSSVEKDERMQQIKYEMVLKEQENEKLKQKISALSQAHLVVQQNKAPRRKIMTTLNAGHQEDRMVVGDSQTKDLLKLNDMLKKRCLEQESQIRSIQAMMNSKLVHNKDLQDKNATFVTLKERYEKMDTHLSAQRNQLDDERKRQSEIMHLLREEREKNHLLEQQVRSMELMTKSAQDMQMDLQESKRQKFELEEKLKILMESPFFKDYSERATVQAKLRSMEQDLKLNTQENKSLRDVNARLETENSIRRQENADAQVELKRKYEECKEYQMQLNDRDKQLAPFKDLNYWDNDQFLKVLGGLKWTGEDPAWRKIEFIDRTYMDSDDPKVLRKEIEHLKLEKGELAAHLEKTQTLLRTRQDIENHKESLHKTEVEKLSLQMRAAILKCTELAKIADLHSQSKQQRTMYEAEGVKYSDSVSVFSVDPAEEDQIQAGENFFDLFLGEAQLDQSGLMQSYAQVHRGTLDPQALLSFLTIDFYDHETQHTSVAEGLRCQYNLQVSFKVTSDGPFVQYLESGNMKVELYMSQGSEAIRLATGHFSLRELVTLNNTDVSKVLAGSITLNGQNNQFVGMVSYKARMRQPISQIIKWLRDQHELDIQDYEEMPDAVAVRKRKLIVVVDKATQLPPRCSSFVYYSLDHKDFNTNIQPGSNPRWDYRMVHEVIYNEDFANMLKKQRLEFFLIDDNQPLSAEGASDKLGMCDVDVSPLLNGDVVDVATEIRNDQNVVVGRLYVKMFWYDSGRDETAPPVQGLIQQSWEDAITTKIASEARSRGITCRQTFRMMDFDNDQIVSFDDFQNGLKNILGIKLNPQEMQLYYQKLPQPLNQQNFDVAFRRAIGGDNEQQPELSQINKMINFNSQQLAISQERIAHVRTAIHDVMQAKIRQGRTRAEVCKEIEVGHPDGLISITELHAWLKYSGVNLPEDDVHQFLQNYVDRDQKVNLKQFFGFIFGALPADQQQMRGYNGRATTSDQQWDIINQALDSILQYAQANQFTLMRVREIMDDNRNGFIERGEMKAFLQKCKLFLDDVDIQRITQFFDTNGDNLISVQEFTEALSQHNKSKKMLNQSYSFDGVNSYVVGYLVSYMKKQGKSMPVIFNEIDRNGDGYLNRVEMRDIFKQKIVVPLDSEEFETFFKKFDENHDDRISIKEFVAVLQPALLKWDQQNQAATKTQPQPQPTMMKKSTSSVQTIRQKAEEITASHSKTLLSAFEKKEDPKHAGFITPANFKSVLQMLNLGFTNTDLDRVIEDICERNNLGSINYLKFVELGGRKVDLFDQTSYSAFGSMSMLEQERATVKTREIFSKISKVIEKNNIPAKQVFATFDQDKNGKIDKQEMTKVFQQMRMKLTSTEIDMIFATLDKRNDQYIAIDELFKWINVKT